MTNPPAALIVFTPLAGDRHDRQASAPARSRRPLGDLERPRDAVANLSPNWFASVMGTGIVAVAASSLPIRFAGLTAFAEVVWALAAVLLVTLVLATAAHWALNPAGARAHLEHPVMSHFYGAVPMAALTVGAATLLIGRHVIGLRLALDLDWALWTAGTLGGLLTAALVPYLSFTRRRMTLPDAFGGWLMPVVPPMVSASTGALLVPHASAGQARLSLLLVCYALFGLSLIASLIIITLLWLRLATAGIGEARLVPTWWIVLGPLGQSITAVTLLGGVAHLALPASDASALQALGLLYGVPVWGFAVLWVALATAITVRTARAGLPFSLTWWSFTFPLGTCVTGSSALARATGADLFRYGAAGLYAALVLSWLIVAALTARGSWRGWLFHAQPAIAPGL